MMLMTLLIRSRSRQVLAVKGVPGKRRGNRQGNSDRVVVVQCLLPGYAIDPGHEQIFASDGRHCRGVVPGESVRRGNRP